MLAEYACHLGSLEAPCRVWKEVEGVRGPTDSLSKPEKGWFAGSFSVALWEWKKGKEREEVVYFCAFSCLNVFKVQHREQLSELH